LTDLTSQQGSLCTNLVHCLEHWIFQQLVVCIGINDINHFSWVETPSTQTLTQCAHFSNCHTSGNCVTCGSGVSSPVCQSFNGIRTGTCTQQESLVNSASNAANHTITNHGHQSQQRIFFFFVCSILVCSEFICIQSDFF